MVLERPTDRVHSSVIARPPIPQHGAGFGNANASPGTVNKYRYPLWGVQHSTYCNGPVAYEPIGMTMRGSRPDMRLRMQPHGSGPLFPVNGRVTSAQITLPREVHEPSKRMRLPRGTPVAPRDVPPSPCPGRNNVVLNTVPGLGGSQYTASAGYLLGANESFNDARLQVPMAEQMVPMTPPVTGTPLSAAF